MHNIRLLRKGDRSAPAVAEGSAEDIAQLLVMWGTADHYEVHDGVKYKDAREFVVRLGGPAKPATEGLSPEQKMYHEDLHDPLIHARNEMVRQWIARALRLVNEPHYDPDLLAGNTAHEVIRLFY
jgi:hypothetical protein